MRRSVKVLLKILLGIFIFLVLVIAGLFVYAKFFYDERDSSYMSFSSLPGDTASILKDFEDIHNTVVDKYSLYRQKGISMDSLHNVYTARIKDSVRSSTDYGLLLVEYFAALHCTHAGAYFTSNYGGYSARYIEGRVFIDKPGPFLLEHGFRDKDEIIEVNDQSIPSWISTNMKYYESSTSAGRENETARNILSSYTDTLLTYTVARGSDTLSIPLPLRSEDFRNITGIVEKVYCDSIGYIAINTMEEGIVESFDKHYQDLRNLPYLIVDIRQNGGGNSNNGQLLCSYLLKQKKPHCLNYDSIILPREDAFQGKVYLLTDIYTCSAAESFAIDMWESGEVILVGMPTNGDTGNGPNQFRSPSGVKFRIPTRSPSVSPQGFPLEGVGVPPHYKVKQTVEDFMIGKDTQLEFVLDLIQQKADSEQL